MEEVIKKIQKLLALAKSSNEHEAQTAMLQVQKLMVKHKLTMKEVEEAKKQPINIADERTNVTYTRARWKIGLAMTIAENFSCYAYNKINKTRTICFFGKDEDVMVCKIMLEYALNVINSEVNKFKNQYKKQGKSTRGIENMYAIGFVEGLATSFEKQKEENKQEWGLVLVKDEAVVQAYESKGLVKSKIKPIEIVNDDNIYNKGIRDGKKFNISDKIANDGVKQDVIG